MVTTRGYPLQMSEPWLTIAPIYNLWNLPKKLDLPYQLNDRVSICKLPDWLVENQLNDDIDLLMPKLREAVQKNKAKYCITVEYQADALGSPDPNWGGDNQRAIQDVAAEEIRNVFLLSWLVHSTTIYFSEVAHIANRISQRLVRQIRKFDPQRPLSCYSNDGLETKDLEKVRLLLKSLKQISLNGNLRTAINSVMRAQTEFDWTLRFLILWLVMENLYGPEDGREINFRLSQRVALFLSENKTSAKQLFDQVKESYAWRSKIVHGLRLAKLTDKKSKTLIEQLEINVRQSLVKILSDRNLIETFDGKKRETFLDSLVFNS
jgi:energy-converting hydrogenase A subunit M